MIARTQERLAHAARRAGMRVVGPNCVGILNPMAGIIDGLRWSALGTAEPDWVVLGASLAGVSVVLLAGLAFFHDREGALVDVI